VSTAGLMLLTPRLRPRSTGPVLRSAPLPVTATVLSALTHGAIGVILFVAASTFAKSPPKTYVVNLVPAVAAVGTPQGKPAPTPTLPPKPEEPAPRVSQRSPQELPAREAPRPAPTPPPDLPARAPSLPDRSLPDRSLPDRALPPRPAATPRAGEKELPSLSSTTTPRPTTPAPTTTARAESRAEPPVPALGRPSGSAQGAGAMTLDVTDFPFAWYLAAVQRKITERWEGRAQPGRQPVAVFEIARNGQVSKLTIEKSSGNVYYDQQALRAITEANPLPPLPPEFSEPMLRIHLGFNFTQDRG
jgi:periplasmic protein TonB